MGHHPHGESSQKADREVEDAPALTRVEEIPGAARWVVETIERRPEPTGEVGDDGGQQGADEATDQSCPLGCTHLGARRIALSSPRPQRVAAIPLFRAPSARLAAN